MTHAHAALTTEPLLETVGAGLRACATSAEIEVWLTRLEQSPHVEARGAALYASLRKALPSEEFVASLRSLLAAAARGEDRGILALAALVHVRAPGDAVIEALREFRNLHRVLRRARADRVHGAAIEPEAALLDAATAESDLLLAPNYPLQPNSVSLPHFRDLGPAATSRRAFAAIVQQLHARGTLSDAALGDFCRLAELELRACELRATALAGCIDPYSSRHVRQVMPILGAIDSDIRDMREFLATLAQERRASLFREQSHALRHHLVREDSDALLERCAQTPDLLPLRRIFAALDRRPLPARRMAYFIDRLYAIGDALVAARLRRDPIDLVEATVMTLEFVQDERVVLPASARVVEAIARQPILGVLSSSERVSISFDERHARGLTLPLELPKYVGPRTLDDEVAAADSIKDLVLANLNNTSVLLGMLKNQKIISTPGIVSMIVMRCRSMSVVETIAERRNLHSGFANNDVPLSLLKCPMRLSVKTLRRFINVRYVNKVDLRRLAVDRSGVRREVSEEIERYLKSLN